MGKAVDVNLDEVLREEEVEEREKRTTGKSVLFVCTCTCTCMS